MTALDTSRHELYFNPQEFTGRIDVVGVGAVGSKVAMELAKLGIKDLCLWDGDEVEGHNISNQLFYMNDIGKSKVEATKEHILLATGNEVQTRNEYITEQSELGEVVFLCVDTMEARKNIFNTCIKNNFLTKLVVEVRMGVEELRVYGFNPSTRSRIVDWENTLVDDEATVESACGAKTTVGATASMTSAFAVSRFMQWFNWEKNPVGPSPSFEQIVMLRPLLTISN